MESPGYGPIQSCVFGDECTALTANQDTLPHPPFSTKIMSRVIQFSYAILPAVLHGWHMQEFQGAQGSWPRSEDESTGGLQ
jgi:hypothetical protein